MVKSSLASYYLVQQVITDIKITLSTLTSVPYLIGVMSLCSTHKTSTDHLQLLFLGLGVFKVNYSVGESNFKIKQMFYIIFCGPV